MNNFSEQSPTSVPWTPRDIGWGLLAFGGWFIFFLVFGSIGITKKLPFDLGLIVVFGEAILLLPVWYFTVHKYGVGWADLGLRNFRPQAIGIGCGLMLASFLFNIIYASLLSLFDLKIQPGIEQVFQSTNFPLAILFGGAIVAPFVEELFFRGFIFTGLRNRWGWSKAALISAGVFALVHLIPTSIPPIFILGLIFAFLYQASGSIWPAILMHMLTNSTALFLAYALSQGWDKYLLDMAA